MTSKYFICFISILLFNLSTSLNSFQFRNKRDNFIKLIPSDYETEEHEVVTEDGYILVVHRVKSSPESPFRFGKPVVLMIHGLAASSEIWILRGPKKDLVYQLADNGYDVWLMNARGNIYSRHHKTLSPNNSTFWDFSFHEIGVYDIPATIDYILNSTKQPRLSLIGHSMGGTSTLIFLSSKPNYNPKINVAIPLAQVTIVTHPVPGIIPNFLLTNFREIQELQKRLNIVEFPPAPQPFINATLPFVDMCRTNDRLSPLCTALMYLFSGFNDFQEILPILNQFYLHQSQGASVKTIFHYLQIIQSREFRQYNLGPQNNLRKYRSTVPPKYPLDKITAPVILYYGSADDFSTQKDNEQVSRAIAGSQIKRVPYSKFGHLHFLFHSETKKYLYDDVINNLNIYSYQNNL